MRPDENFGYEPSEIIVGWIIVGSVGFVLGAAVASLAWWLL